ncbi:dephospho-CoA kinase [Cryobacterium tepidiphilum]|uniref:Dephospho-CoA kinase n=1 Tax=Cryobacterium tepidiphilum TaxID=2486026 RepID=A0A3M8LM74_9MICO|nr:dephospho-CoA kinase [Cryobacterium tepidiphilum]RNE66616.1 dephospho-CoA kinase [Cryobacterium tepidiphilum]
MYLIGLTGGIASGKSTIARRLAEQGAVHIDADRLAREVVEPGTEGLARIRSAFGDDVIAPDGTLDRAALGQRVFGHPEQLATLNAIVHPAVRALTRRLIAEAEQANPDAVVVYDVPLLVEAAVDHPFDLVVVAHADESVRRERLIRLRGFSEADAARRLGSQAADAERLAIADVVIDTDGSIEQTASQADALWERVVRGAP